VEGDEVSQFGADTETETDMMASPSDGRDYDEPKVKLQLPGKLMTRRGGISIRFHIKVSGGARPHDPFCQGSVVLLGFVI
jgi:hypothetical protein